MIYMPIFSPFSRLRNKCFCYYSVQGSFSSAFTVHQIYVSVSKRMIRLRTNKFNIASLQGKHSAKGAHKVFRESPRPVPILRLP